MARSVSRAVAALLLCQMACSPSDAELDCYSCGGLEQTSCPEFREALSWSVFRATCPDQHVCVKQTSLYSGEEHREIRGCGEREASFGLRHEMGCRRANTSESRTEFCFCDAPLCNAAVGQTPPGVVSAAAVAALVARWIAR